VPFHIVVQNIERFIWRVSIHVKCFAGVRPWRIAGRLLERWMKPFDHSLEQALIDWAVNLRFEDLPEQAVRQSKRLVIDTLAAAWAGAGAVGVDAVRRFVVEQGGKPVSRLWGGGERVPAPSAAWFNGLSAAALDFDSVHDEATMHPDIIMVPALVALADLVPMSGRDFITAHVAGDELMVRLGLAAGPHPGFFLTSALGVFVCAAVCARVLGLSPLQMRSAMGIVLSRAAGSQQTLIEGSFSKRLQSAYAARDGVEAALLARAGVTGPLQALTGKAGFSALYAALDASKALDRLGDNYRFLSLTLKQYPSCFCNHAPIVAALEMIRRYDVQAEDIVSGKVVLTPMSHRLVGGKFLPNENPQIAAQFSVQYSLANVFLRRRFSVEDIQPEAVLDPAVMALSSRFLVKVDETLTSKFVPATVTLRLRDGTTHSEVANAIPGMPDQPLSDDQMEEKATNCLVGGPLALTKERAAHLIGRLKRLEEFDRMSDCFV
jgi:2-methylcitrate dehydratase PrpD